jgi:hypothetical protein
MKTISLHIVTLLLLIISQLFITDNTSAQAPQKMSYQAIIRDATGVIVRNKPIGIRIQILQGSEFGGSLFVETHNSTTNENGLVSLKIGGGTWVYGSLAGISWADGPYFLKTETDPNGGTDYSITGSSELLSVPYALFAGSSMPVGSIIMYSGVWNFDSSGLGEATLDGWALCNGNNGTPDLTDKFVMGTGTSSGLETTGGKNSFALMISQLPSHSHNFTTLNAGDHSHSITLNSAGNHGHSIIIDAGGSHSHTNSSDGWGIWHATDANYGLDVFEDNPGTRYFPANSTSPGNTTTSSAGSHSHSSSCSNAGNHTHSGSCTTSGEHVHSGTTESSGLGDEIDNRPSFIKLAYIIKL